MTKIAACMIVRNSAEMIATSIGSIRPFVDEINVLDTGSTDKTIQVLTRLSKLKTRIVDMRSGDFKDTNRLPEDVQAKEHEGVLPLAPIRFKKAKDVPTFENGQLADFAWARAESYAMASEDADWTFWLDDDDVVIGAQHLRGLAMNAHPAVDGFVFYYDYARDEQGNTICELWRERLVRQGRGFRWICPVHEVYLPDPGPPSFVKVEKEIVRYVHQRGAPDRYPSERNLLILERAYAEQIEKGERPDPRTTVYLGTELMSRGRFAEAEGFLKEYLLDERTIPGGDERVQAAHKLALCLRNLGRTAEAIDVEFEAMKERDDWLENVVGLVDAFAEVQNWPRVEHWARRALELPPNDTILIINPIELSFTPRYRLSQALAIMGRWEESKRWLDEAAAILPDHPLVQETVAGFGRARLEAEASKALLTLREVCIRFDENFKAFNLMENAPYIISERPEIVAARAATKENVLHALRPEEYKRWYEDEPKESTVPDEWVPIAGDHIERVRYVLELCQAFEAEHGRKPRVLDLGCNDFWQAGYLWTNGEYVCDGVELNKASVEKAQGRIERFGMPGRIVQGDLFQADELLGYPEKYDIVTCFEVYEHVPDTERLLETMEALISDGGYVCLTTPNGAFEQGNIAFWHLVERKGHLRATPIHEVAKQIMGRGNVVDLRLHQGDRLVYACYQPAPKKGKVIIWGGGAWEEWSPRSVREGGIGGSETMLSILAVKLGQQGYDVTVYSDAVPGWYAGSLWRPTAAFDPTEEADAYIVSRNPEVFRAELHAPVKALWCHDMGYPQLEDESLVERMSDIIVLSEWQRERFARLWPHTADKLRVIGNGILLEDAEDRFPPEEIARGFEKRKPRAIYSSSADRGLDVLFEVWPRIRESVPDAELHVFYGWDTLDRVAALNPALQGFKQHVLALYQAAGGEDGGIYMRGRVGQIDLYREMREARVWAYPTAFLETSCITAMEARANGLAIVTSDLGALSETVGIHGHLIPWGDDEEERCNTLQRYQDEFVEKVVAALSDPDEWLVLNGVGRAGIEKHDFNLRLREWEELVGAKVLM